MQDTIYNLGDNHSARIIYDSFNSGEPVGLTESHLDPNGNMCGGTVWFADDEWHLLSLEPLTIMPSIVCDYCPAHGMIIESKWVDCSDSKFDHVGRYIGDEIEKNL